MNILIGNAGNDSIALLQSANNQALSECYWVSVDTGFAAPEWVERAAEERRGSVFICAI